MSQPGRPGAPAIGATGGVPSGRFRSLGGQPARTAVTRLLAVAFVARGLISISDALSVATEGLRPLPVIGPVAFSAISPLWSLLWAILAIAGGIGLAFRWRLGWLVSAAVAVAYLVSGIADLSLLDWSSDATIQVQRLFVVVVDLVIPAAALFLLSRTRDATARPLGARRPRREGTGRGGREASAIARREAAALASRAGAALTTPRRRAPSGGDDRSESALERWRHRT